MPCDDKPLRPNGPDTPATPDATRNDRERRHAARQFFHLAPPYCIEFDADGSAMLCQKVYEYWPDREPEAATTWRVMSRHQNLEEAERRLRLICGGPVYYDADGNALARTRRHQSPWDMPPTDDE